MEQGIRLDVRWLSTEAALLPLCRTFTDTSFAKLVRELQAKYVSKAYKRLKLVIQSYLALRLNYVTHTLKWQLNCRKLRRASRDWILKREPTSVSRRCGGRFTWQFYSAFFCQILYMMKCHACLSYDVTSCDILHTQCEGCDNTSCLLIGHFYRERFSPMTR